jgi:putative ABC transport system permease protein
MREAMGLASFGTLALKRTRSRWGLTLLSLVGIVLIVGLLVSIPVFTDSVGFHILRQELASYAYGNANPLLAMRYYRVPNAPEAMSVGRALETADWLGAVTSREIGLPIKQRYVQLGSHAFTLRALPEDTRYAQRELRQVRVNCIIDSEEHIEVIEGRPFAEADTADELLVWARPELLSALGARPGEVFEFLNYNAVPDDKVMRVRIAGSWQATDPSGPFWYRDPHDLLKDEFLTTEAAFTRWVAPFMPQQTDFSFWYYVMDDGRMRFDRVDQYSAGVQASQFRAEGMIPSLRVDRTPIEPLQDVQRRTAVLRRLLYGFSLPIMGLLLFFVASIASIAVRYQRNELAILVSRGTSRLQVLAIAAMEGCIHIACAAPMGMLLSLAIAEVTALNSSFLSFDRREPLALATQALDWRLVALASTISLGARLIPSLRGAARTIVTYGRERARATWGDITLRALLSAILIATTAYAYNQLRARGTFGLVSYQPGEDNQVSDPLLFLAPTLFIFTAAWVSAQVFPWLMRLPDLLATLLPSTSLYLGFRNLARESQPYRAPLFLLAICLCLGAFEASIARSADVWLEDRIQYAVGADYAFTQTVSLDGPGPSGEGSWLLPPDSYRQLTGVHDATRVGRYIATPTIGRMPNLTLFGVDRLDFARVAHFRPDYAPVSLGELMNRLGATEHGLLVTREFLARSALAPGDTVTLDVLIETAIQRIPFEIVGTLEYFPTANPAEGGFAVANLDYIFDQCGGVFPHSIWLRTDPEVAATALWDELTALGVVGKDKMDAHAMLEEDRQSLERVGIFGNLSVGFVTGSILACLGLFIYTFASLRGRVRRFTILRAMGLGLHQVLATVSIEYLVVVLYGVLAGTAAGIAASRLYVPYFQFTDHPAQQIPPFTPQIAWSQILWIAAGYLLILVLAEAVVLWHATRREVFRALRIGDEE